MANYNIVRNGYLTTVTGTVYGNMELSWAQLEKLVDGNTTSSGITMIVSDVVYLDVDLSNRIKIDGINLYTSSSTISGGVYFYYRNTDTESYTAIPTLVNGTNYYTEIPSPSAPRFVRAVVSGVSCDIYEYEIFNDDYIVAFGTDGQAYEKYIDNADVGEESQATELPIYNNSSYEMPANAYICVDWTDNIADYYLEIANSQNGPWYSIEDGVILDSTSTADVYDWNMGAFYNTKVETGTFGQRIILNNTTLGSGTYVSPIFSLDDAYETSYFVIDSVTYSGTTIAYSDGVIDTIRVRSSNTPPIKKESVFLSYGTGTSYIYNADPYTNIVSYPWKSISYTASSYIYSTSVHRATGRIAVAMNVDRSLTTDDYSRIVIFNKYGTKLYDYQLADEDLTGDGGFSFDYSGGLWVYSRFLSRVYALTHISSDLSTLLYNYQPAYDFVTAFATEIDGDGVWYIDNTYEYLVHLDANGVVLVSKSIGDPTAVASAANGACWVFSNSDNKFYKFSSAGTLLKTVSCDYSSIAFMDTDYEDGFWYSYATMLFHVNHNGTQDVEVSVTDPIASIRAGYTGCAVFSYTAKKLKWVDKESGNVARNYDLTAVTTNLNRAYIGVQVVDYDDYINNHFTYDYYPRQSDPIWGTYGSLEWREIPKDGHFLPKRKYHQVSIKLKTTVSGITPRIDGVIMTPTIKITDIHPNDSENMYIRSNIPQSQSTQDYETRLRCWWSIKDV